MKETEECRIESPRKLRYPCIWCLPWAGDYISCKFNPNPSYMVAGWHLPLAREAAAGNLPPPH
eukprot:934307-Pelagomonas_calceolata.AAC.1